MAEVPLLKHSKRYWKLHPYAMPYYGEKAPPDPHPPHKPGPRRRDRPAEARAAERHMPQPHLPGYGGEYDRPLTPQGPAEKQQKKYTAPIPAMPLGKSLPPGRGTDPPSRLEKFHTERMRSNGKTWMGSWKGRT